MTNYLSLKTKLEEAQAHCQRIVDKAVQYGWTEALENSLFVAQQFEVFLYNKLHGSKIVLKKVHAEHFS